MHTLILCLMYKYICIYVSPAGSGLELSCCSLLHVVRVKGGVRGSLVATSAAARCQGPRFYSGQGRNLDRVFCSMCTAVPPLGPQHRVPEPVPSLETHLKSEKVKGRPNGWRYVGSKEETRLKSDGRKSEWKTSSMEGEGKGDGHQYGRKPRTPEPIPAGKTHLVRKRWDIGLLRALSPRIMMMMTKQNLQIVQNCSK